MATAAKIAEKKARLAAIKAAHNSLVGVVNEANASLQSAVDAGDAPELVDALKFAMTVVVALNAYSPLVRTAIDYTDALVPDDDAGSLPTLTVASPIAATPVAVTFAGSSAGDWLAFGPVGGKADQFLESNWAWTDGTQTAEAPPAVAAGTVNLKVPNEPGNYEVWLVRPDASITRVPVTVLQLPLALNLPTEGFTIPMGTEVDLSLFANRGVWSMVPITGASISPDGILTALKDGNFSGAFTVDDGQ